jgi:glycosyltransferase involved in cell wall biosynthesis
MPIVSIIIPTHDRGELLSQTLASVRAQSFEDWEAIVVDDHSKDDTIARLHACEAEDGRIRHLCLPSEKTGAQAARNAGIAAATGRYLILLDSDDLLARECLSSRVAFMEQHADLDAAIYACEVFGNTPGDTRTRWNVFTDEDDLDRLLKWDVPWQTTSPIWRTEAIRRVGPWDESVGVAQDWLFHLTAIASQIKYRKVDQIDHYWRKAAEDRDSIGKNAVKPPLLRSRAQTMFRAIDILKSHDRLTEPRKRMLAGLIFQAAERLAMRVSRREARQQWEAAISAGVAGNDLASAGRRYFRFFRFTSQRPRLRKKVEVCFGDIPLARSRTSLVCPVGTTPTVSCVMPAYNAVRYLASAINSILGQTFGDFELIVVDDGSTDHTLELLRSYEKRDARVRVISRSNTGHTGAINDGIAAAKGELIARMDADDLALPERFARQVAFLREHPEVVVVGASVELIDPYDIPIGEDIAKTTHAEIDAQLLRGSGGAIRHPLAMFRRDAYERVGPYRTQFNGSEDLDLWLRLAEIGKVANLPDILLKYRRHYQAFSFAKNETQMRHKSLILAEACQRRGLPKPELNMDDYWRPPPVDEQIRKWGWQALKRGRVDAARAYGRSLVRLKPASLDSWRLLYAALRGR